MTGKIIFVIVVIIWFLFGMASIIFDNDKHVNWGMIISILIFWMLPLIAHFCGLL